MLAVPPSWMIRPYSARCEHPQGRSVETSGECIAGPGHDIGRTDLADAPQNDTVLKGMGG